VTAQREGRASLLVAVVLVALAPLSACGGSSEPKNTPLDVLRAFDSALASGNGKRACSLLTDLRRSQVNDDASVQNQDCVGKLSGLTKPGASEKDDVESLKSAELGSVIITGDTAIVQVTTGSFGTSEAQLEHQENGKWRVSESAAGF
jgi:Domain of unknown function (DUF4878)